MTAHFDTKKNRMQYRELSNRLEPEILECQTGPVTSSWYYRRNFGIDLQQTEIYKTVQHVYSDIANAVYQTCRDLPGSATN